MSNINKQELAIPQRKKHNWGQAVMRDCDFCHQWALTVKHDDGGCICASCCDAEYTTAITVALEMAIERAEAAEKRVAQLEAREVTLPRPACTYSDHSYPAYSERQVVSLLETLGMRIKGED